MSQQPDVSGTLSDLERKLRDLEQELATVARGAGPSTPVVPPVAPAAAPAVPVPVPVAPAPSDPEARRLIAEAKLSLAGLHHQLEDLVRVRDDLERSTRELMQEYSRGLGDVDATPAPDVPGAVVCAGPVTLDAGPFPDILTLSAFEQALARIPGTEAVHVRRFERDRALIDVVLGAPLVGTTTTTTAP